MKKLFLVTAVITSITSSAFAKTAGNQLGVDILYASAKHKYNPSGGYGKFDDSNVGFGANYKYAISLGDNIFIAPGVFAEKLGTEAKDDDRDPTTLNYRYGAKLDVGYDITDKFAVYATVGAASINYKVDWKSIGRKTTGNEFSPTYGLGFSYNIQKNLALNFEYNYQQADLKTPGNLAKNKTELSVAKIGVAYRF